MNLVKSQWRQSDRQEFLEYLRGLAKPDKIEWTRKIINTKLDLLAIPAPIIKNITKEIAKGNFFSFLKLGINDCYEAISINGNLIMKIKDFALMQSFLIPYAETAENWATCDLLHFPITSKNKSEWWHLAIILILNKKPFARRIGVLIFFKFIEDDLYIEKIFDEINGFFDETEYYVNMALAWLLAECFAKQRSKTLAFLKTARLSPFVANKMISKCRDSFRVSEKDKIMLLKYKKVSGELLSLY